MATGKSSTKIRRGNAGRTVSGDKAKSDSGKRKFLWTMVAVAALLIIGVLIFAIIKLPKVLYTENDNFRFRNLEIDSTGYWNKKEQLLLQQLGLKKGVNLFSIDIRELRHKLQSISSIENAEVRIVLPDTLKFKITERIPRAKLRIGRQVAILDKTGTLMKPQEASISNIRLPLVINMRDSSQLQPAMNLIMAALNNYPDLAIQQISLANRGELRGSLWYRRFKTCMVYFPAESDTDYLYLLSVLQTTILRSGSDWKLFDLRYRGSVTGR